MSAPSPQQMIKESDIVRTRNAAHRAAQALTSATETWRAARKTWGEQATLELDAAREFAKKMTLAATAATQINETATEKLASNPNHAGLQKEASAAFDAMQAAISARTKALARVAEAEAEHAKATTLYEAVGMHYDKTRAPAERWVVRALTSDGKTFTEEIITPTHSGMIAFRRLAGEIARRFKSLPFASN